MLEIILGLLFIASVYLNYKQFRRNESLEEHIIDHEDRYEETLYLFKVTYDEFKKIDQRGYFETDDEVGTGFKMLKTSIESLDANLKELQSRLEDKK